ncbi:6-phosphogluconolactonase [Pseudaminobacter sp. 19-2017]|uniref:6-phosphogluconolactonase n=2 Tax=Pseudaminobacter soli (ex Zhang et al. 2022) TaxID=2831468 RepID=A0A942E095_9HYPH|nr:6-phosphogluconolactonase [Pseudaminobacter soli]
MAAVTVDLHELPTREALAEELSQKVAYVLTAAIERRGKALLAVSGGTTPALFFRTLSDAHIDWPRVTVTLVDERFVPEDSPRSNARLARENLLQGKAAAAGFTGLFREGMTIETAAAEADGVLRKLGLPIDAVVLGMGGDGHTASFFPDADQLPALLSPTNEAVVAPVHATSAGEPRLTLTMPAIIGAPFVALHIEGEAKRQVLASVLRGKDLPIRAVFEHARKPVEVFWAP